MYVLSKQMLQAVYDFQAPYENTLSFAANDLFVVLKRNNKDKNWVHVVNLKGVNGYAPASYLTVASCSTPEEIEHIDRVLNCITCKKQPSKDQASVIESLLETRSSLEKELESLAVRQAYELSSIIRRHTKCTFPDAQAASFEALGYLQRHVFPIPNELDRILKTNVNQIPMDVRMACEDNRHLEQLVKVVMEIADDRETDVDVEVWDRLLELIRCMDSVLSTAALERHDGSLIRRIIEHLQVHTSWHKRNPILKILFHALQLKGTFLNIAINSVLPEELVRDIRDRHTQHDLNKDRLCWSVRVLTVTLCSMERLSVNQRVEMDKNFVSFVLQVLDSESVSIATADDRNVQDLAAAVLHLILALYRQFQMCSEEDNPVLDSLANSEMCSSLLEKMIILYNREGIKPKFILIMAPLITY